MQCPSPNCSTAELCAELMLVSCTESALKTKSTLSLCKAARNPIIHPVLALFSTFSFVNRAPFTTKLIKISGSVASSKSKYTQLSILTCTVYGRTNKKRTFLPVMCIHLTRMKKIVQIYGFCDSEFHLKVQASNGGKADIRRGQHGS